MDKLLTSMPDVIAAHQPPAEPGGQASPSSRPATARNGMGASQVTGDITRIVAQFPALFETLTGMKMSDLMSGVTGLNLNGTHGQQHPGRPQRQRQPRHRGEHGPPRRPAPGGQWLDAEQQQLTPAAPPLPFR